jgi:predicted 2-oxoglutarate/Fe(II)-dependent dioxygenase YbiX|tara:strand:- start:22650 stop:23342 length:693 start_codon:yes stop_codon:yes gene_type:complete
MIEYFPYHRKLLKKKIVKELLNYFDQEQLEPGTMVGNNKDQIEEVKQAYNGNFADPYPNKMVWNALDLDDGFAWRTLPKSTEPPMLSRSEVGHFYHPHHDSPFLGDYSTTILLNDDYEGGEFQLRVGGEIKNYRLKSGEAITYPTGMDHCVRPVTKGERKALILWTKSDVSNPFLREISSLAQKASLIIRDEKERKGINPYLYPEGIEDASNDPHFLLNKIITIIARAES